MYYFLNSLKIMINSLRIFCSVKNHCFFTLPHNSYFLIVKLFRMKAFLDLKLGYYFE